MRNGIGKFDPKKDFDNILSFESTICHLLCPVEDLAKEIVFTCIDNSKSKRK